MKSFRTESTLDMRYASTNLEGKFVKLKFYKGQLLQ